MGSHCFLFQGQQPALCSHIRAASQCYKDATSLTLKNSALNSLPVPQTIKTDIWQLATDTPGPLVQRVSKNIMVVKCKPEALYPLGFLHFNFQQVSLHNCCIFLFNKLKNSIIRCTFIMIKLLIPMMVRIKDVFIDIHAMTDSVHKKIVLLDYKT